MPLQRSTVRKIVGVVFAIPLVLFAGVAVINCFDESPSPLCAAMLKDPVSDVPDTNNLYLAVLGLNGPEGVPISASGRRRFDENQRLGLAFELDPGNSEPPPVQPTDTVEAEGDFSWCQGKTVPGMKLPQALDLATEINTRLLDDYLSLPSYSRFVELSKPSGFSPFFFFSKVRCLFIARQFGLFRGNQQSQATAVSETLADLGMWKLMLAQCDDFMGKLIGAASIRTDLALLVDIEAENPALVAGITQQLELHPPWTDASDWMLDAALATRARGYVESLRTSQAAEKNRDATLLGRINDRFWGHFIKEQATDNLICAIEAHIGSAAMSGPHGLVDRMKAEGAWLGDQTMSLSPKMLYNPFGRILAGIGTPFDTQWPVQLSDAQVFERMARLGLQINASRIGGDQVETFMTDHPELSINPVTGASFSYDRAAKMLSFEPQQKREKPARSQVELVVSP